MTTHAVTDCNPAMRCLYRYRLFFMLGCLLLGIQVFLAYKSLDIPDWSATTFDGKAGEPNALRQQRATGAAGAGAPQAERAAHQNSVNSDDEDTVQHPAAFEEHPAAPPATPRPSSSTGGLQMTAEQLGFQPQCTIAAKEAISALQRAKTKECRKQIADIACSIQKGDFYVQSLPNSCPNGNHTANAPLGCYKDTEEARLLPGYFVSLKDTNSPRRCINLCLQSGFPYAGVQYGLQCFCGNEAPSSSAKLADTKCNMKCTGEAKEVCGGYYTMNIYETGISKFTAQIAETSVRASEERVRIAFLLTLNGRALRQVHRLIRALYAPQHVFYIHVDARQDYLYRELLQLEPKFSNIRLARQRHSTIWGGASLLTMLLQCMSELIAPNWRWDFVINLSESDYPVKTVERLADFLTANRGRNFVKSHGRETQRFIQKQGLDKTFVECDTHMWRIGDRVLPTGIQMDGGSDWVALSRPFVEYVTQAGQEDDPLLPGLMVIFRHTLLPAESFFHTVLRNSRFCHTYVDNNLHVTNWKRKLGCKCQYKHVVDWCGCSPNDFKPSDWARLQGTEHKMLYFARKFEPVINQAVLRQLDEWLYGDFAGHYATSLNAYWQSLYDAEDGHSGATDLLRTVGESVARLEARKMDVRAEQLLAMTTYMRNDQYKGFLVRFTGRTVNATHEYETRVRPVQYTKMAKNSRLGSRIRHFEVASEFDQKEQVARNLAKILGPYTEPVVTFTFAGGAADSSHSYNLTLLWIDPVGRLQDFNELHVEDSQTDSVHFSKSLLRQPLTPGIWTVKLIGLSAIYAQAKFLVVPLALWSGRPIQSARALAVNMGAGHSLPPDFELPPEWLQYLPPDAEVAVMQRHAAGNAQRLDAELHSWIDDLVSKFYHIREVCARGEEAASTATAAVRELPLCRETVWSSLAPDPKSDIDALLADGST